jgi:hypothetical protein
LEQGEVAINVTDKKVWVGNAATTPVQLLGTGADGFFSSITDAGNLTFTGTGNRITGDFSNATVANRVMFQTSTTNGSTSIGVFPNGTSTTTNINLFGGTDAANASIGQLVNTGTEVRLGAVNTGAGTFLPITMSTSGSERLRINTNGKVGIGTSSPDSYVTNTLQINGSGASLRLTDTTSGATKDDGFELFISGGVAGILQRENAAMTFSTNSTERMRITETGNLLVGTTTNPVSGSTAVIGARGYATRNGYDGAYSGYRFLIDWTGTAQLWIDATNIGTIAFTSDYRIKRNIETQTAPALERVMALRPVTYQMADYKDGLFKASDDIKEGFIAHEVQEVIPSGAEGVKDDENQIQSLRVDAILAVAVKAIQEQQAIITDLKSRIEALENK